MQFQEETRPRLLGDRMKQLAELHRMAMPAIEDLCGALWLNSPPLSSFYGWAQCLQGAVAQAELWKRSTCMEGAREAYAVVQTWWSRLDLDPVA